jgi:cell division protein FtsA
MDTRIDIKRAFGRRSDEEFSSPLYATAVGLVMNSIDNKTQSYVRKEEVTPPSSLFPIENQS